MEQFTVAEYKGTHGKGLWTREALAAILDGNTLLTATTCQDSKLDAEACFFTDKRPRFREGIDELTIRRVCRYNEQALAERLARLFALMALAPKQ